jgi:hypothetical protein
MMNYSETKDYTEQKKGVNDATAAAEELDGIIQKLEKKNSRR